MLRPVVQVLVRLLDAAAGALLNCVPHLPVPFMFSMLEAMKPACDCKRTSHQARRCHTLCPLQVHAALTQVHGLRINHIICVCLYRTQGRHSMLVVNQVFVLGHTAVCFVVLPAAAAVCQYWLTTAPTPRHKRHRLVSAGLSSCSVVAYTA
ncbi:hypothetical protein V8C86DRAFT_1492435 [Haematococcus lacustris]